MTSWRNLMLACTGFALLLPATAAHSHAGDPKALDYVPPVPGPGYRLALSRAGDASRGGFEADGVQLMAWLPIDEFGSFSSANDCWGYTSSSGREYAIIGFSRATAFVEVTNPSNPVVVDVFSGPSSTWRDMKTYREFAYVVTEGFGEAIQVFDLSQIDAGIVTQADTVNTGSGGSDTHNVAINTTSGYLYRTGGSFNTGLRIYNLSNPAKPEYVSDWNLRYIHDAQVVTIEAGAYAGREIAFCCSGFNNGGVETGLDILDVSDKQNIIQLARLEYPNGSYSHQAWLSEDQRYLYLNDEGDEDEGLPTTTYIIDVLDPAQPEYKGSFTNGNPAIGHNLYVRGHLIFEANYRSGLRVFDACDPLNPVEIAYFDTWPGSDAPTFNGLWSTYPYFDSGVVIGSDYQRGLFVWRVSALDTMLGLPPGGGCGSTECAADLDGSTDVNVGDLLLLFASWGSCVRCPADIDASGVVDLVDLLELFSQWGGCP